MTIAASASRYLEMEVLAMHPARRVVFLYQLLLSHLQGARAALDAGLIEERCRRLLKAQEVVDVLQGALNLRVGGEIATQLNDLYAFFMGEILEINRLQDAARLERLARMVAELHAAWTQAAEQEMAQRPLAQAVSA